MTTRIAGISPRVRSRITGVVYLLYFLTAILGKVMTDRGLTGSGHAVSLIATLLYIVLTLLLYYLLKPVNGSLCVIAAVISLAGCTNDLLRRFNLVTFRINSLALFGPFDVLIGYLIVRSTFLPRFLGTLMVCAGFGWLFFLSLPPAHSLVISIEALGFVAEALLMLWLLVKGVNGQRWDEQASQAEGGA